ncbi:GNAT family N-acetyltransferase [Bacillus sp. KH172YL63]|uniref:GNAT family N-acetyltransferase n=1 Tax=Bacillus sp. KH172YL63 TaxID=2709784 RepID=UPI0013E4513D|nr:GNAT family N-acetyltransferase [Bacillus sp. KH172YL63]BCB04050.1 N-acetyltransferase [Bacillus sp. KH172YL63]
MIQIKQADPSHVRGIMRVCSGGYWATYGDMYTDSYIERVIEEFYNEERVLKEVKERNWHWGGYFVAVENDEVVGAAGGGMISESDGELFVLYIDPARRNEGIGTMLLDAVTHQQKHDFKADKQWVSVQKGNEKGIPFYEARGFVFKREKESYRDEGEGYVSLRYERELDVWAGRSGVSGRGGQGFC